MRRALTAILLSITMLAVMVPAAPHAEAAGATSWTIMLYMADTAGPSLPWEQNLNQMEAASQAPGTNIIALVDTIGSNTTIYRVAHDPGGLNSVIVSPTIDDGGAVVPDSTNNSNMGSPQTLSSFIEFAAMSYPADRYVLILWGHGSVWYGLCIDGGDILTLPEVRTALEDSTTVLGRPLDILGVDACAEAMLEMLYEIQGCVRYFVGSEKDVPLQGLPYQMILDDLAANVNCTAADFGATIAKDYVSWSRNYSSYSATMAVFDLSNMPAFKDLFYSWVRSGIRFEGLFHSEMRDIIIEAEHYELDWLNDFGGIASNMLASTVPNELQTKTADLLTAFRQMRLYSGAFDNPDPEDGIHALSPTGAVVYCPSTNASDLPYADLRISSSGWVQYSHMLRRIASSNVSAQGPTLNLEKIQDLGDSLYDAVTLHWPENYSQLEAWVYREQATGLVFCAVYMASGDNLTIHDPVAVGDLLISASAGTVGTAVAYSRIESVALTGEVNITVTLANITGSGISIRIVIDTGSQILFINATDTGEHNISFTLFTPRDVRVGDVIKIQVDAGKNMTGNGSAVVNLASANATIELHERLDHQSDWILLLAMAALAIGLIAIFGVLMYRENRKNKA
jgi:hypothetical protein